MYDPRDFATMRRCPVSMGLCIGALVATALLRRGLDPTLLVVGPRAFADRPWQLLTSTLPHIGALHLIFNAYWTWQLGTRIEYVLGSWRMLGIFVLLAVPSSAAEYAFSGVGVGLSGVGFGLVGLLWVLDRQDPRFRGALDRRIAVLFLVWFFVCIALTATNILPVANIAHGVGALAGVLVGWTIAFRGLLRALALGAQVSLVLGLASVYQFGGPGLHLNPEQRLGDLDRTSIEALRADEPGRALPYLERAVEWAPRSSHFWHNRGVALQNLDRPTEAHASFERASALDPGYESRGQSGE